MTLVSFDGVTYFSNSCRLLDFGKGIEVVRQENPSHINTKIFLESPASAGENKSEQSTRKNF